MNTALFKKYTESLNFDQAIENIELLTSIRATPMKYIASLELACSRAVLDSVLKTGSVKKLNIDSYCLQSICDKDNTWHCLKLTNESASLLLYTGGTSYIMYYSVI